MATTNQHSYFGGLLFDSDDYSDESDDSLEEDLDFEYPPEKIIAEFTKNKQTWYLVKWEGCPVLRSSWEGIEIFNGYEGLLREWEVEKQKQKEGKSTPLDIPTFNKEVTELFQPSKDFQIIKEGQDIEPGLHVRLNIYTGEKEARLNIPMKGEEEYMPTEQELVIVPQPDEEPFEQVALRDRIPQGPPIYEAAGKITPPQMKEGGGDDFSTFQSAMSTLKSSSGAIDTSLDSLVELSHDIYYGVEIVKDGAVLEKLACLLVGSGSSENDHKAASILSYSLQNNPNALKEVHEHWKLVMYPSCTSSPFSFSTPNLISLLQGDFEKSPSPLAFKAKISAISHLLRQASIRDEFLKNGGMELMLQIFLKEGREWDAGRVRIAQLVMDNFLDDGMGAELGIWPKGALEERSVCQGKEGALKDGCWEFHLQALAGEEEWASEFLMKLMARRPRGGSGRPEKEL
ncbi:hypothetical protein B7494_g8327 [Chlorociboria aeruginascens]|nr:hypothetical protein B7494_g8327 [Chlorociboria aeruginascens]